MEKKNKRLQKRKRRGTEEDMKGAAKSNGMFKIFPCIFLKRLHVVPQNVSLPTN
jgi:hypothetical protein